MSLNISNFIKKLFPSIGKSDIEVDMNTSLESIPMIVQSWGSYAKIADTHKLQSKQAKKLLSNFYKEIDSTSLKVRLKKGEKIGEDTVTLFENVKENGEWLLRIISDSMNDVIMSQALSAYNANLLRTVPHYYFMTKYAGDLLSYIYILEAERAGTELDSDFSLNKKQVEFLEKNMNMYARLLGIYGEKHSVFVSGIEKISSITIPQHDVEDVILQYRGEKLDLFNNLPAGFIGSPIYSVRLVFAQWEADRYRALKDKKKLLELRHLHYKLLKEQGTSDVTVEKEIMYLQKRLTEIDYKVAKLEEGL